MDIQLKQLKASMVNSLIFQEIVTANSILKLNPNIREIYLVLKKNNLSLCKEKPLPATAVKLVAGNGTQKFLNHFMGRVWAEPTKRNR